MSFILEAVGHMIRNRMETPKDRDAWWNEHIDKIETRRKRWCVSDTSQRLKCLVHSLSTHWSLSFSAPPHITKVGGRKCWPGFMHGAPLHVHKILPRAVSEQCSEIPS